MENENNIDGILAIGISVTCEEFSKRFYKDYKKDVTPETFEKQMIKALKNYINDLEDPNIEYKLRDVLKD
jgi:hypothetical protein